MALQKVQSEYVEGSSSWDTTYTTVCANSATWEGGGSGGLAPDVTFWAYQSDDEDFDRNIVLLPFNRPHGSTFTLDHSQRAHNILTLGGAYHSTAQTKFGTSSMFLDGVDDYIVIGNSSHLDFSTFDFTMELWYWYENAHISPSNYGTILDRGLGDGSGTGPFWFALRSTGGTDYFGGSMWSTAGGAWDVFNNLTGVVTTSGIWHHIAIVRDGNNFYTYHDGEPVTALSGTTASPLLDNDRSITIGVRQQSGANEYFGGYIDDVRITNGLCRYPGGNSFTLPSSAGEFKRMTT